MALAWCRTAAALPVCVVSLTSARRRGCLPGALANRGILQGPEDRLRHGEASARNPGRAAQCAGAVHPNRLELVASASTFEAGAARLESAQLYPAQGAASLQ